MGWNTHEVSNQFDELQDYNLYATDTALQEAVTRSPALRRRLAALCREHEPCLVLHRQTHSMGQVASVAALWHPASRYRFTGQF